MKNNNCNVPNGGLTMVSWLFRLVPETTRERVEREALNRLSMIYNFRRAAFVQGENGEWQHMVVWKLPDSNDFRTVKTRAEKV